MKSRQIVGGAALCLAVGVLVAVPLLDDRPAAGPTAEDRNIHETVMAEAPLQHLMIHSNLATNKIEFERAGEAFTVMSSSINSAIDIPRDVANIHPAGVLDASRFVFCGAMSDGRGAATLVTVQANGSFAESASYFVTNSDFVGVGYSAKKARLYLLDNTNQRVVYAAHVHTATSLPQSWTVLVTSTTIPALNDLRHARMGVDDSGADPVLVVDELGTEKETRITDGPGGVSFVHITGDPTHPILDPEGLLVGQTTVPMSGPPNLPVEIRSVFTNVVHGTGSTDGSGAALVTVDLPLQLGDIYAASQTGQPELWPRYLAPYQKWGFAESISSTNHIVELGPRVAMRCETPNPNFSIPISFEADAFPTQNTQWTAMLVVGTPADIVAIGGGQYALLGSTSFTEIVDFTVGNPGMTSAIPLPITDLGLAGADYCGQWWVSVGASFKLSNIACLRIRNGVFDPNVYLPALLRGRGSAAQSTAKRGTMTKGAKKSASLDEAIARWLKKCGGNTLTAHEKAIMLKAVAGKSRR